MSAFKIAYKKAAAKNIWIILGVACLASAWLIEKQAIKTRESQIEAKRFLWEQYRSNNNIYALITSKFETMRLMDLATSTLPKDTAIKNQMLLQLRFALFDHLKLRIETDEAVYLLEKDPLDKEVVDMFNNKRIEITNALNTGDINRLLYLHERDNDFSFNNAEVRTKQYVQNFNKLLEKHQKAEYVYLLFYILGSLLFVFQKIKDTVLREKESLQLQTAKGESTR
jgi:hypothetical protein